jgi:hypothetical protein
MVATMGDTAIIEQPVSTSRGWLWLLAALALAFVVHAPLLGLGFVGDDFEWWLAARTALEEPRRLLLPYGGFRPANLWMLVLEELYGTAPMGYHLTSILPTSLRRSVGLLMRRLGSPRPRPGAGMCSPLAEAGVSCERFEPMLLMSVRWHAWPGRARRGPRPARRCAPRSAPWASRVVLPASCFELVVRRVRGRCGRPVAGRGGSYVGLPA